MTASGDSTASVFPGKIHVRNISVQATTGVATGAVTISVDGDGWFTMETFPPDSELHWDFGGDHGWVCGPIAISGAGVTAGIAVLVNIV
jgi:hypothetical protein